MTQPQEPAGLRTWVAGRRPTGNGLAISAIVTGAFLLSYTSLYQLALACGYSPLLARVWPLLVDGFTAYCSRDAWHAYQQRRAAITTRARSAARQGRGDRLRQTRHDRPQSPAAQRRAELNQRRSGDRRPRAEREEDRSR